MSTEEPLFTAAQLEPTAEELAKARARVAGRDRAGTHLIASSALCVHMPALIGALTMPYSVEFAARSIRALIAAARAVEERLDELDAELDARLAELDAQNSTATGRPSDVR
ncbi:hypothetical protein FF36_05323 [Frankia torreyi]|uniref:Uncharacterized protein n=1 Tax=Frankia torreyi TaxID=1856 RepID=A0A0D8B8V6_9ACTN|nr:MULTISPECIES: hypothetical protein [Frankia]KJE20349.1 hypothetical protein FF36_05323 [Frankia torreyi]KQM02747.1 hypothetical protein FF86_105739 [Frankia sp. CpI1-P]